MSKAPSKITSFVKNKEFRYDIAMLRLLCITIVVFFHAYGMTYVHFSDITNSLYAEKYEMFNQTYLINIAMPMFIFISGFLFGGQLLKSVPTTFIQMVKSKFMRLMVPFFVFAILFMFTQNAISFKPFYQWTYSHLWFLPMLFWCFMGAFLLRPLILNNNYAVSILTLVVLCGISLPGKLFPPFIGLHNLNTSIGWFAMGMWFNKHEETLMVKSAANKVIIIIAGLAIYFFGMTLFPTQYGKHSVTCILLTVTVIYALWTLFVWIPWKNLAVTDFLMSLSACSFGIFIFHNWLEAHMISRTAQRLLNLEQLAYDHVYLFPLLFSIAAFVLSLGITWILLRFNIGRKLLG